jgi:ATP-dependent Clp protease ATP-binding subunit ClpC
VIGRDEEIEQAVEILAGRRKNNVVLIGEAGVGKTAIAEGLVLRIVDDDVPQRCGARGFPGCSQPLHAAHRALARSRVDP